MPRYILSGKVQGVGFRYFARRRARDLALVGRVRNRRDGSVEVVAEGDNEALSKLLAALRQGPPWSRVDEVLEYESPPQEFRDFEVEW